MTKIRHRLGAISSEDGFTMVELLWASVMLVGLFALMGTGLIVVMRAQPQIAERSNQIQSGRAMVERITRELREGSEVEGAATMTPTATGLSFLTFIRTESCGSGQPPASAAVPAIECRVTYTCTAGSCVRSEVVDGATPTSSATLVEGLNTSEVFGYSPSPTNPRHVSVTLEYPADLGGESVTLSDGAALRNTAG